LKCKIERKMATYKEIQKWVKKNYGFVPRSCWIAHVKEIYNLNPRKASNRRSQTHRMYPCPSEKIFAIKHAFRNFKMIT
jgi:hypothetical protein